MEKSIGPVFTKCPKCAKEGKFIICDNCQKFDEFELVQKPDGSRAAKCSCENETIKVSCECGTVIHDKFFYQNQNLASEIKKHKKEIAARQKVSFGAHWFAWTVLEFTVLLIVARKIWVLGGGGDLDSGLVYVFNTVLTSFWVTLISSWLPASISWVVHKNIAGRACPEEKGGT